MNALSRWLLLAGFCLLIYGAKLSFIAYAGSDLPTWDQWDAEGAVTLQPWIEGRLGWRELLHPHNEHRLVTTKLWALGLFQLNGQWDAFVETTANAAVHTAAALVLLLLARRWLRPGWLALFGGLLVILFVLPFSWENTLFGFQVQFYFLLLFSLGHLILTLGANRCTLRWWLGQACAALSLATMASGFLSSAALLTVLGLRTWRTRQFPVHHIAGAAWAVVCVAVGWSSRTVVEGHAALKAHGLGQLLGQFADLLAWPGSALFPWSIVLALPSVWFLWQRWRARTADSGEDILAGLLVWIFLQALATAYARGGSGSVLSPRYLDLLAVHVAVGCLVMARAGFSRWRLPVTLLWLIAIGAGLCEQSRKHWRDFVVPNTARQYRQEANLRAFLATGDRSTILDQPWGDIPFPDGHVLLRYLESPALRHILPVSVRPPLGLPGAVSAPPTAVPAGLPTISPAAVLGTWQPPGTHTPLAWRSAPQTSPLPYLRFRVAGDWSPQRGDIQLAVVSATERVPIEPDSIPGAHWKTITVPRPSGPWWLEVNDSAPEAWVAITAPLELGRLSYYAGKLRKHHAALLVCALGLLITGGAAAWRANRQDCIPPDAPAKVPAR